MRCTSLHDSLGDHSLIDLSCEAEDEQAAATTITNGPADSLLCMQCGRGRLRGPVLPWPTAPRRSATLQPTNYYLDLLGRPENTVAIDAPSPFW